MKKLNQIDTASASSGAAFPGSGAELSPRLKALFDMVPSGGTVADIGTDHGFLPIALVREGKADHAIASDLREGPLEGASAHIREAGLSDRIETRRSDGFDSFEPGEADTAVISGMGGLVMLRILKSGAKVVNSLSEIILQPQSEIPEVRKYLHEQGFLLVDERIAEEDGKFYFLMKALTPGEHPEKRESPADLAAFWKSQGLPGKLCLELGFTFGPVLLMKADPLLLKYLEHQEEIQAEIRESLNGADPSDERIRRRANEIRTKSSLIGLAKAIVQRKTS